MQRRSLHQNGGVSSTRAVTSRTQLQPATNSTGMIRKFKIVSGPGSAQSVTKPVKVSNQSWTNTPAADANEAPHTPLCKHGILHGRGCRICGVQISVVTSADIRNKRAAVNCGSGTINSSTSLSARSQDTVARPPSGYRPQHSLASMFNRESPVVVSMTPIVPTALQLQLREDSLGQLGVGMTNLGNSCYQNAICQFLLFSAGFFSEYCHMNHRQCKNPLLRMPQDCGRPLQRFAPF